MKFIKSGIHTRLNNIIYKSGGYDINSATNKLIEDYNISYSIAREMAYNENIREEISAIGLDNIISLTEKSIRMRKMKMAGLLAFNNVQFN